jgi:hypothetical protein
MSEPPMMPKATAVWLIENTALTFQQVAEFCGLHPLEVQGIADGEVAKGIQGLDPTLNNQLTKEEIERCEGDSTARLQMKKVDLPEPVKRTKGPRYTPVAKRQDKPDGVAYLLRHFPDLKDAQVSKLIGTTKATIQAIRERTHWNSPNIRPRDPVLLGLCSQTELNAAVEKARRAKEREEAAKERSRRKASGGEPPAAAAEAEGEGGAA